MAGWFSQIRSAHGIPESAPVEKTMLPDDGMSARPMSQADVMGMANGAMASAPAPTARGWMSPRPAFAPTNQPGYGVPMNGSVPMAGAVRGTIGGPPMMPTDQGMMTQMGSARMPSFSPMPMAPGATLKDLSKWAMQQSGSSYGKVR